MPDSVLFRVQEVEVELSPFDLPGPTRRKVACARCGQVVRDHREVTKTAGRCAAPAPAGPISRPPREIVWDQT